MKLFYLILIMLVLPGCNHDIKFDRVGWQQQSDPAFPSQNRKYMLDDLLESYDLKGKRYSDITHLLDKPDFHGVGEFGYSIESRFGYDIDPVYAKNLLFTLDKDSTVRSVEVKEWKK